MGALLGAAEPGLGRQERLSGWRSFFERLAVHKPVALVFEDMQWADAGRLDFIEQRRSEREARIERGWPRQREGSGVAGDQSTSRCSEPIVR